MSGSASHHQLVVVGSSAGGIDALSVLVSTLPALFPAPIVIAQHLDPRRESHLAEILARRSTLPVRTVHQREHMEAGVVYVVPANKHAEIVDGHILLRDPAGERSKPSVDRLLSTAAANYGRDLIAVILSGTGSDGTAGARAVKDAGGIVIIQDPSTASFGAMPASLAPATVDIVSSLERIGPLLSDLLSGGPRPSDDRSAHRHPSKVNELMGDKDLFATLRETILPELIMAARKRGNELRIWSAGCGTGEEAYSVALLIAELLGDALEHFTIRVFATDPDSHAIAFARHGVYPAAAIEGLSPELGRRHFFEADGSVQVSKLVRGLTVFGVHDLVQRAPFPRIDMVICRDVLGDLTSEHQKRALKLFAFSMRDEGYLVLGKTEATSPPAELFSPRDREQKIWKRYGGRVAIPAGRIATPDIVTTRPLRPKSTPDLSAPPSSRGPLRPRFSRKSWTFDLPVGVVVLNPRYDILQINAAARALLGIHRSATGEDLVHLTQSTDQRSLRAALHAALRGETPPPLLDFPVGAPGDPPRYVEIHCRPQILEPEGRGHAPAAGAQADSWRGRARVEEVLVVIRDTTGAVEERARLQEASVRSAGVEQEMRAVVARLEAEAASLQADNQRHQRVLVDLTAALARERAQGSKGAESLARHAEQVRELRTANEGLATANDQLQGSNEDYVVSNEEVQAATEEIETLNEEFQATNEELDTLNEEFQATIEELNTTNDDLEARGRQLTQLARTAEAERVRLSAVLVAIGDGVLVVDRAAQAVLTNAAFNRMFDAFPKHVLDESGNPIAPEKMPDRRAASGESFRMEFAMPVKDTGPRDFEAIGQPVCNQSGECEGGVVVIRDISERSMRRLQDRFLAMASHELRTPLVPLQGYLQLLQGALTDGGSAVDTMRYAQNAVTQVRRVTALVNELVDATRFQSGKFNLDRAPIDLGAVVTKVVQSADAFTRGQAIRADIDARPLMVDGDAARLEQVVVNLLTNAVKYAPDTDRIDVRARRVGGEAEIEVEDHGPGIPEAEVPRLFWPFYQVPEVDQPSRGGLGLGLFICSEIIASHGGNITVRSAPRQGAVFTVRLRLLPDAEGSS